MSRLNTPEELEALLGPVVPAALQKESATLVPVYQRWIQAAPFVALATNGPDGLDVSPRGDPAPVCHIADAQTLLLPERRGNNRADSLRNLLHDPRCALLFLIPGIGETLRVNGRAELRTDAHWLQRFAMDGKPPVLVLKVHVERAFFQCARATARAGLWGSGDAASRPPGVPTAGEMLQALTDGAVAAAGYDAALPQRQRETLY